MKIPIDHFANLARLSVTEKERVLFKEQIHKILDYMNKLNELDTSNVEPTSHVISLNNVLRDDLPSPCLERGDALANAPDHTGTFYRVPRIIE
jgi:aspartyl-tRNA(Asn)/glutamyl-tRNA(Gln) amidotransferase subunit C